MPAVTHCSRVDRERRAVRCSKAASAARAFKQGRASCVRVQASPRKLCARSSKVGNRYNEHVQTHHNFIHIKHRMRLQIDRTTWFSGITPSHVVLRSVAAWDRIPNTVAKCSASNSGLAPTVGMGVVPTSLVREKYVPNSRVVVLNDAGVERRMQRPRVR